MQIVLYCVIVFKIVIEIGLIMYLLDTIVKILFIKRKYININSGIIESKISGLGFFEKIRCSVLQIENMNNKSNKILTPFFIILLSFAFFVIAYVVSYKLFKLVSTSCIIAAFSFFLPHIILKSFVSFQKQKIIEIFPTYAIALKNYTKVSNDIIIAFKKVQTQKPLAIYIDRFNLSIEKGIKIYDCFERLKQDINIKKINEFIGAAQMCYINGGDFSKLLEKYAKILTKTNMQKAKEKEESFGSKLVLYILIGINIYLLFAFVLANFEYKQILMGSFLGKTILNINILSYMVIFIFIKKLSKMDE
ncbi:MAG: hypothetical protein RSE00_01585 [Clostridia bacterium]